MERSGTDTADCSSGAAVSSFSRAACEAKKQVQKARDNIIEWVNPRLPFVPAALLLAAGASLLFDSRIALVFLSLFLLSAGVALIMFTRVALALRERFEDLRGQVQAKVFVGGVGADPFSPENFGLTGISEEELELEEQELAEVEFDAQDSEASNEEELSEELEALLKSGKKITYH